LTSKESVFVSILNVTQGLKQKQNRDVSDC
jgi:hypothetical protein